MFAISSAFPNDTMPKFTRPSSSYRASSLNPIDVYDSSARPTSGDDRDYKALSPTLRRFAELPLMRRQPPHSLYRSFYRLRVEKSDCRQLGPVDMHSSRTSP